MVAAIPENLPAHLEQYAGQRPEQIPESVSLDDFMLLQDHADRKDLQIRIRQEAIQQRIAKRMLDQVDAEMDSVTKEADIQSAATRRRNVIAASKA